MRKVCDPKCGELIRSSIERIKRTEANLRWAYEKEKSGGDSSHSMEFLKWFKDDQRDWIKSERGWRRNLEEWHYKVCLDNGAKI